MQPDLTDITLLLDRSGSMESIRSDTIGGINAFLEAQKKAPGRAAFSLHLFDDQYESKVVAADLATIQPFTNEDLVPRGWTALHDAAGRCINETGQRLGAMPDDQRPGKVLFVIVTDGMENRSKEFTAAKVKEMTSHQSANYQWEFVYLGANQDAFAVAADLGIPTANVLNYAADAAGTARAYEVLTAGAINFRSGGARAAMFTPDDQCVKAKN